MNFFAYFVQKRFVEVENHSYQIKSLKGSNYVILF